MSGTTDGGPESVLWSILDGFMLRGEGGVPVHPEGVPMEELRVTATLDPSLVPPLYATARESGAVSELRAVDWNLAADGVGSLLYAIDGDAGAFRDGARETDGVERVALSREAADVSYALVDARPAAIPFFSTFVSVTARAGLVVRKP